MKTIMIMLVLMLSMECGVSIGQVPDKVLQSFKEQYPQSDIEGWECNNHTWIANFYTYEGRSMAYFSPDGEWVKTETEIPWRRAKDLPMGVNMGLKYSDFASWEIDGVKEVKYPDKRDVYVMKVEHDCGPDGSIPGDCTDVYKLYFTSDGRLVRERRQQ